MWKPQMALPPKEGAIFSLWDKRSVPAGQRNLPQPRAELSRVSKGVVEIIFFPRNTLLVHLPVPPCLPSSLSLSLSLSHTHTDTHTPLATAEKIEVIPSPNYTPVCKQAGPTGIKFYS